MDHSKREITIRSVNFWWYPLTLLPIAVLLWATLNGYLPGQLALLAVFALFFWIFSLLFAIYAKLRPRKEPRQ